MAGSKKRTQSSSFGVSGRSNHDASEFYNSSLYADLPSERTVDYYETPLPDAARNQIFGHSNETMDELPEASVHLMVTSPPYNAGKDYDQDLKLDDYLGRLRQVWAEVRRVLVPGGRACINVANLGRKPYIPLHSFIIQDMIGLGFLMRGEIIWDKAASASASTAWGSWQSASNPTLRDVHEYILVFSKDNFGRPGEGRTNSISKEDFLENTKSVWDITAVSAKKIGHPAPFPQELPQRLIELYTFDGDVVLDPFMGSGTTALAARATGRDYVGYEIEPDYVKLAEARLKDAKA
ncbi:MAG: site-specific DNA-methyltransferase [Chloroflexi bacterium]|nr:site-specific DNA-methyltransferase [Chloroflexota bacterium]